MAAATTTPSSRPSAATTSVVQLGAEADTPLPIDGSSPPSLLAIGRLVGLRLRVIVSDGRVLSGVLSCLDPQGNLVLSDTLTLGGLGGKKKQEEEKGAPPSGEVAATTTTTEAHAPLSLDDGHHHSHFNQQQHSQDHAMGMVIVPRSKRVRCCVEVESFEVERVSAEIQRATTGEMK